MIIRSIDVTVVTKDFIDELITALERAANAATEPEGVEYFVRLAARLENFS